jgi:hypothetical protein
MVGAAAIVLLHGDRRFIGLDVASGE